MSMRPYRPGERKYRTLTQEFFEQLCTETGGVSNPALLLDYLHHVGIVFYQQGLFDDRIVLDQEWALQAVYAVSSAQEVLSPDTRCPRSFYTIAARCGAGLERISRRRAKALSHHDAVVWRLLRSPAGGSDTPGSRRSTSHPICCLAATTWRWISKRCGGTKHRAGNWLSSSPSCTPAYCGMISRLGNEAGIGHYIGNTVCVCTKGPPTAATHRAALSETPTTCRARFSSAREAARRYGTAGTTQKVDRGRADAIRMPGRETQRANRR